MLIITVTFNLNIINLQKSIRYSYTLLSTKIKNFTNGATYLVNKRDQNFNYKNIKQYY